MASSINNFINPGAPAPTADDMRRWAQLEDSLRQMTREHGLTRKNGDDMVGHWISVGRRLRSRRADNITIAVGYCHDIVEDVSQVSQDQLRLLLLHTLGNAADADQALALVHDCSYQPCEYEVERQVAQTHGVAAGKAARKELACKRWISHPDVRVHQVKTEDVNANEADCDSVSVQFGQEYRAWALPLRTALVALSDTGLATEASAPGAHL